MEIKTDVIIIGGGLAGSLAAYKILTAKPNTNLILLEEKRELGGHHTWSFHESDLPPEAIDWVKPFISRSWDRTTVQFPRIEKTTEGKYHSVRSEDLHQIVTELLGDAVVFGARVERATETQAILKNGDTYTGELVIDSRGLEKLPQPGVNGFHKFICYDLQLSEPHGVQVPIIMDATCPQLDGFRYFSLLPWDEKRVLVQETYYSDAPELNVERISRSIESFAQRRGWKVLSREREEINCLPMPMTSEYLTPSNAGEPLPIGTRGGYFHATTTSPFPDAVKIAEFLANQNELSTPKTREALMRFRRPFVSRQRFYRLLNRFLFFASEPSLRYQVLQALYEQPSDVVARYTGGRTSWGDRLRVLSGKSSFPLERALKSFSERVVQGRIEG